MTLVSAKGQENIWQHTACKEKVWLTPYLAQGQKRPAIIVCPGGSYFWHDMKAEGKDVGAWLQRNGITAFVLRYRTAYVPAFVTHYRWIWRGNRYPDPQDDLRQAIRYVKQHAERWNVDTTKIGAMGFSAGGHLVVSGGLFFADHDRPAFIASLYPVVTMSAPCVHKRSRRALMGESRMRNHALRDALSLEKQVTSVCPPVFLANCIDDPIVDYRNAILLDSALTAQHVPHVYYQYRTGGHGFGASETKGSAECRTWKQSFLAWLSQLWKAK